MTFSLINFEIFLLILVRISGFIFTGPFFSLNNVPFRVKTGLAIFLAAIMFYTVPVPAPGYESVIEYSILVIREAIAGAIIGLFANIAFYIINFAGQIIDMEIGFSMVNQLDPVTLTQSTITANIYGYLIILVMIITDLHHYFLRAIIDSFQVIQLGDVFFRPDMYELMVRFVTDYFIIGFRIVIPIYGSILVVNTILAILSKVAPQINMFVIGIQLKIIVGLFVLAMMIQLIPSVADFIFNDMITKMRAAIQLLKP